MKTFIEEKIKEIYERHQDHLDEISIIIPNKRASFYIQKAISDLNEKPIFSPKIITIDQWIDQNTTEKIVNQTELLYFSYKIHCQIEQEYSDSFEDFLKWGKIILSDFDEIDRYLIDPKEIFTDLRNIKKIENWSFGEDNLSEGQEKYMEQWDKLPIYYSALNKALSDINSTYQGKAYQNFYNNLLVERITLDKHYYFLGFNALSKSEQLIIQHLSKFKQGTIYFDIDKSYHQNKSHEASHFFREICKNWNIYPKVDDNFNRTPKKIEVIETSQQIAQVKIAGNIVKDLISKGVDKSKIAIILADESLLIPLTKSLPSELEKANITMGYPLKFSHLTSLVDLIFELQFSFQRFNSNKLYHRSILRIISHPYIQLIIDDTNKIIQFENEIIKNNKIFIEWEEFIQEIPALKKLEIVFSQWKSTIKEGFDSFNTLIKELYDKMNGKIDSYQLELEILYHFSKGFKKFEKLNNKYKHKLSLKAFKQLFEQFWQSESLSFLGNPIDGLQVMGVLETRTLDFENIIILGMNEGNLPRINFSNSMIPRDLKMNHKLPLEEDRQAIFAHHFYRLLHRAQNIYMTYNSSGGGLVNTEKSRFILQLENELDFKKGHVLQQYTSDIIDTAAQTSDVIYQSSEIIHKKLDEIFEKGLSPSALNKLINCPLDFYYRYILGLYEDNEVEENIESSTFGTNVHEVLELILKKHFVDEGRLSLNAEILKKERKNILKYLHSEYLKNFTESDLKFGQNRLSLDISKRFIEEFLDHQINEIKNSEPIFIESLEEELSAEFKWKINGKERIFRIRGLADRIDSIGSLYRIIDYKTGKCNKDKVSIQKNMFGSDNSDLSILIDHKDKGHCRQLLMYALMFRQKYPERKDFTTGIISMVNINDWLQNVYYSSNKETILSTELMDEFEEEVKNKISQLYSFEFKFEHNPDSKFCEHCDT